MRTTTYQEIFINNVERETEKAVLLNLNVTWNYNKWTVKQMWFPKSVVADIDNKIASIASWFLQKQEVENAYRGYRMSFDTPMQND